VRVAAFASAADWEGNRRFAEAVAAAAGDRVEVHIPDPPPGTYGIAAYQDLDADGVLSKSWLGVPREPYGFSNGARGVLGPPAFDEIRFPVADAPFALRVELE
jgi:uncharacterized protein (DUF2141 family)